MLESEARNKECPFRFRVKEGTSRVCITTRCMAWERTGGSTKAKDSDGRVFDGECKVMNYELWD